MKNGRAGDRPDVCPVGGQLRGGEGSGRRVEGVLHMQRSHKDGHLGEPVPISGLLLTIRFCQLFGQYTLTITIQFGPIAVFAERTNDLWLIELEPGQHEQPPAVLKQQ